MESREKTASPVQAELVRRHRVAAMVVRALIAMTIAFIAIAFTGRAPVFVEGKYDPMPLRIVIVVLGIGAVALRRTKFSAMRLQDIAALRGISGLLATLQNTTILVAVTGGVIAIMGFIIMMITGEPSDMVFIGVAALAVLLYAYPRRAAWQRVVHGIELAGDANDTSAKGRVA